jgi:hypothetical protein
MEEIMTIEVMPSGPEPLRSLTKRESSAVEGWAGMESSHLSRNTLFDLFNNFIPFIRVAHFAAVDECEAVVREACLNGFSPYSGVEPRIIRIGCTVFEYDSISKDSYFRDALTAKAVQERIFGASCNLVARMIKFIADQTGLTVGVAQDREGRFYYAGLIRRIEDGTLLHIDYAPAEQTDWSVCDVVAQLSWNVYLRISNRDDGHTHVFKRQWTSDDMAHREGSYGFKQSIVEGSAKATFKPQVGELILFNTKNYHRVDSTKGERVTVTSALGLMPNGQLVLWS